MDTKIVYIIAAVAGFMLLGPIGLVIGLLIAALITR